MSGCIAFCITCTHYYVSNAAAASQLAHMCKVMSHGTSLGAQPTTAGACTIYRVGHNRVYAPYMTVYLVTSLPKIPYISHIYICGSGQP
jgi:hypothetical protein